METAKADAVKEFKDSPVVPLTPSDNPPVVDDPLVQDAPDLSLQGDEALQGEN